MPQKYNRAGQLQNYVPAGNGDASGEYGDNASGSNKHFTSFKKPSDVKTESTIGIEEKQSTNQIKYSGKEYNNQEIETIITRSMGVNKRTENVDRVLEQLNAKNVDPTMRNVVMNLLSSNNYKIVTRKGGAGYYSPLSKEIHFSSTDEYGEEIGETFFHETGHALDYSYIDENGKRGIYSRDYISKEFGMSMIDMKNQEIGEWIQNGGYEQLVEESRKEFGLDAKDYYDELLTESQKINRLKNKAILETDEYKKYQEEQKYWLHKYSIREITEDEYWNHLEEIDRKKNAIDVEYEGKDKIESIKRQMDQAWTEYKSRWKDYPKLYQKYTDLSDMCQAIDFEYKFCGGHDSKYFESGRNGVNASTECFAEIQSALSSNKESLSILEKIIPNTIKIYREIIGGLNNG